MKKEHSKRGIKFYSYGLLIFCCIITALITYILFSTTRNLLDSSLKRRLSDIATAGALMFDPIQINKIIDRNAVGTNVYKDAIFSLQYIKNVDPNIKYAYLLRPTDDLNHMAFVADSYSLNPDQIADYSQDGIIDEEDALSWPGDIYDVTEIPALRDDALKFSTTDAEPVYDQWGLLISAYAPIKEKGETIAILGLDVEVGNYLRQINRTFVPFAFFVVFLLLLLSILTVFLVQVWQERVDIMQDLDRQKDELLGIVAHQLAKPITAIRWDLESLLDGELGALNAEQKDEARTMRSQAVNLADLVSMILDVSRIQLGKMQFDPRPLELNTLFAEMLDIIKPTIEQKKIHFVSTMPETFPTVYLDKRYTRMTIENLLTNAVKYTPEGGNVTLNVAIENGVMSCSISDTGCGIPKADQGKIFGKMYRASNVVNTVDGNGFGLYVAKGAVEGQGGTIRFESTEGKGTTFFITLPMKAVPEGAAT